MGISAYTNAPPGVAALADATANPTAESVGAGNELFNGATWDRQRGNVEVAHLPSASRTTTQTGADAVNYNGRGIKLWVDITVAGTGSITVSIQERVTGSTYRTILASAALTAIGTTLLLVYPGATPAANAAANEPLPRTFRIVVTANNANAMTYSVDYTLIV